MQVSDYMSDIALTLCLYDMRVILYYVYRSFMYLIIDICISAYICMHVCDTYYVIFTYLIFMSLIWMYLIFMYRIFMYRIFMYRIFMYRIFISVCNIYEY